MDNKTQIEILSTCRFFANGARYSQLRINEIENDLFNYHLQQLVKNGYLNKKNRLYHLTQDGKSLVTNIDTETKKRYTNYKVSTYLCPVIGKKILLYKRLKHPQYGYTGLISGKIPFGENVLTTAKREFSEETSLEADFKIIGLLRQIRRNKESKVIEDGTFFICYTDKISGTLQEKGLEGEYFWVNLDKISLIEKLFKPSVEKVIEEIRERISGKTSWQKKFIYEMEPEPEDY